MGKKILRAVMIAIFVLGDMYAAVAFRLIWLTHFKVH